MSTSLRHYLTTIENALKAGNATEHTHRPALKALLESLDLHVTATNEPKSIACGAPDYIISRDGLIVGYVEAKDVGKSLAETHLKQSYGVTVIGVKQSGSRMNINPSAQTVLSVGDVMVVVGRTEDLERFSQDSGM